MLEKYRATIHGNLIEWENGAPRELDGRNVSIIVDVTLVESQSEQTKPNGKRAAEALAKIAATGGAKVFGDPLEWQREIRKDRPLPGRD